MEYYGLVRSKGPRRLARWSPDPKLLLSPPPPNDGEDVDTGVGGDGDGIGIIRTSEVAYEAAMTASNYRGGILLENANVDDLGGTLHLKGSIPVPAKCGGELHGVLYHPAVQYNRQRAIGNDNNDNKEEEEEVVVGRREQLRKTIAPYQWYASILHTTMNSEPVLHCHGLHEWAMLYHPNGAPPPTSASYQKSLPLRVSRTVINDTVERRGVQCTHVDALRFFAPAAGPLNKHGMELARTDQLRLEQKGCVHAHMDLLKIGLKLGCFMDSTLMADILEVTLDARTLDVAASPYDASVYGLDAIPVETTDGRRRYREEQIRLMRRAEPVRRRLLDAYEVFLMLAFDESLLGPSSNMHGKTTTTDDVIDLTAYDMPYVAPERFAKATPGGLPWRRNIVAESGKEYVREMQNEAPSQ